LRIIGVVGAHSSDPLESVTLEEIEGGCPIADALVLEAIAESLRSRADGPSAEALAAAAGCEVRYDPLAPIEGVLLLGRIIVVRPRHDPRAQELAVLHELSHAELDRSGLAHSHGDVWSLRCPSCGACGWRASSRSPRSGRSPACPRGLSRRAWRWAPS
jgi:hypothetical protein